MKIKTAKALRVLIKKEQQTLLPGVHEVPEALGKSLIDEGHADLHSDGLLEAGDTGSNSDGDNA